MISLYFTNNAWYQRFEKIKHAFVRGTSSGRIKTFKDTVVVITGTLSRYSRKEAKLLILNLGGITSPKVNHNTDFLIVTDAMFNSGRKTVKMKSADSFGIPIIPETDFYEVVDKTA